MSTPPTTTTRFPGTSHLPARDAAGNAVALASNRGELPAPVASTDPTGWFDGIVNAERIRALNRQEGRASDGPPAAQVMTDGWFPGFASPSTLDDWFPGFASPSTLDGS